MSEAETTNTAAGAAEFAAASQGAGKQQPDPAEIRRLKDEAAGYRVERNSLRESVAALEKRLIDAEAKAKAASDAEAIARGKALQAHIRSSLAAAGIRDPEQVAVILPGLSAKVEAEGVTLGDDFLPSGDLDAIVASVAARFSSPLLPPSSASPIAQSLSRQLPSPHTPSHQGRSSSPREQLAAAILSARVKP